LPRFSPSGASTTRKGSRKPRANSASAQPRQRLPPGPFRALAWQLTPPRIRRPLTAIAVFNGLFVLLWLSPAGLAWLREQIGVTALLGIVGTLVMTTAIGVYAMWLLPNRATHPRELLPGALLVAVGAQVIQIAVVFYFAPRLGRSEETYGAFGAAATILIWLYVISRMVTSAAFLNATLWSRRLERAGPGSPG
jgi:uncharacterized BrkB/YihY/UPF0761 family membrane protein